MKQKLRIQGTCFYHHKETAVYRGYLTCTKPSHINQDSYRQCRDAVGELAEVRVMVSLHNSEIDKRSWEFSVRGVQAIIVRVAAQGLYVLWCTDQIRPWYAIYVAISISSAMFRKIWPRHPPAATTVSPNWTIRVAQVSPRSTPFELKMRCRQTSRHPRR